MAAASFRSLFEEAEQHEDYWIERAILEVTEEVSRRMDELGVTRAELARRLGTSPAYVTKVLRGDANFTLATMVKLSRALGCDLTIRLARPAPVVGYRHLHRQPGVRGGNPVVRGTRIGVHDVVGLLQNGETVDSIVSRCFPTLSRAQIDDCLAYYEEHRAEIDPLIARQMERGDGEMRADESLAERIRTGSRQAAERKGSFVE